MSRWLLLVVALVFLAGCDGGGAADTTATTAVVATTVAPSSTILVSPTVSPSTTVVPASTTTEAMYLAPEALVVESFPVPTGSRPHDVAPAADGGVWYTAQNLGELGWLDPTTGETVHTPLGAGSRPHGVIVDDVGTPWITDGGLNAIVSVDPTTVEVTVYPLPKDRPDANFNTAVFAGDGRLWFTGQSGIYGSLDTESGEMTVYDAPRGGGPYGITATPDGDVYYASLAGSYVGRSRPTVPSRSWSRLPKVRGRAGCGPTRRGPFGSANGTAAASAGTNRAPASGPHGPSPGKALPHMPYTSMRWTLCG